jgi:uncharacterized RDD family membrane protein YckC
MTENTQDVLLEFEPADLRYASFWPRFLALLLDGLVLSPFVVLDYYNKVSLKNLPVLIIGFLITLLYKPFMEFRYGATLGKMALGICVRNYEYQKPTLKNAVLRSIIDIGSRGFNGISTAILFFTAGFREVNSFAEYGAFTSSFMFLTWINFAIGILMLVDIIIFFADSKNQSLHDKIGQTFVVAV